MIAYSLPIAKFCTNPAAETKRRFSSRDIACRESLSIT